MEDKITITIEGMKEEPVVEQVDGFALVTFAEEKVKQYTYGLRTSELATASNVLQAVCIRDLLTQQESK